jgi:hypothetical protein
MFLRIIFNCFDKLYDNIKTPIEYLKHINKIYKEYTEEIANIKTFIQPIKESTVNTNLLTVRQKTENKKISDDLENILSDDELKI